MDNNIVLVKTVEVNGVFTTYEVHDESFEDDYGSFKSDYAVYSYPKGEPHKRKQFSTATYYYSRWEAEGLIPKMGQWKRCSECKTMHFIEDLTKYS